MSSLKRKSDVLQETQTGHFVMCFTNMGNCYRDPLWYMFESYPIEKFITQCSHCGMLEPEEQFVWHEVMEKSSEELLEPKDQVGIMDKSPEPHARMQSPPYFRMSFLYVRDSVYAVGGHTIMNVGGLLLSGDLPKDFTCISLSTPLQNSRVESKFSMHERKYLPLIVEIGGSIYVLSRPPDNRRYGLDMLSFESYCPSTKEWVSLPEPPFSSVYASGVYAPRAYTIRSADIGFSYVVIGAELYVSTEHCSCIYDTKRQEWKACDLFSDFVPKGFSPRDGCGAPFPFFWKPMIYTKNILLCAAPSDDSSFVRAYKIIDGKKAIEVSFEFDPPLPHGRTDRIVDLGDDYFTAILHEESSGCYGFFDGKDYMTIVTFKVAEKTGEDGGSILKGMIMSMHHRMWNDLMLSYAFARRP